MLIGKMIVYRRNLVKSSYSHQFSHFCTQFSLWRWQCNNEVISWINRMFVNYISLDVCGLLVLQQCKSERKASIKSHFEILGIAWGQKRTDLVRACVCGSNMCLSWPWISTEINHVDVLTNWLEFCHSKSSVCF